MLSCKTLQSTSELVLLIKSCIYLPNLSATYKMRHNVDFEVMNN